MTVTQWERMTVKWIEQNPKTKGYNKLTIKNQSLISWEKQTGAKT